MQSVSYVFFYDALFFFNDTATTEIYTLSLHDALPICFAWFLKEKMLPTIYWDLMLKGHEWLAKPQLLPHRPRSEEHTSELQSRQYLVCRLLLEKKKNYYCILIHSQTYLIIVIKYHSTP